MGDIATITTSGRLFPLLSPTPQDVFWPDVSYGLSRINRFNGATYYGPYTVAQHCMVVAETIEDAIFGHANAAALWGRHPGTHPYPDTLIERARQDRRLSYQLQLAALLHDAHEAYIGDITTPVATALRGWSGGTCLITRLKNAVDAAIYPAAGLPWPLPQAWADLIACADAAVYATEVRDLMQQTPGTATMAATAGKPLPRILRAKPPEQMRNRFYNRLTTLMEIASVQR